MQRLTFQGGEDASPGRSHKKGLDKEDKTSTAIGGCASPSATSDDNSHLELSSHFVSDP